MEFFVDEWEEININIIIIRYIKHVLRIDTRVCTERTRRGDGKISLDSSDKLKRRSELSGELKES